MQTQNQNEQPLSPRWTREILLRCTPREILVLAGTYGVPAIARRMGYVNVADFFDKYVKQERP